MALRAARFADALDPAGCDASDGGGLRRVRYFAGQLLGATISRSSRITFSAASRAVTGCSTAGIVDGLAVTIESGADPQAARVVLASGLAFDKLGREIGVDAPWSAPLPASGDALLVRLGCSERRCRNVAASTNDGTADAGTTQPTRIVETFAATVAPSPVADAIAAARRSSHRGWRVDPKFTPPHVRP